jgi:hypothetical protein
VSAQATKAPPELSTATDGGPLEYGVPIVTALPLARALDESTSTTAAQTPNPHDSGRRAR